MITMSRGREPQMTSMSRLREEKMTPMSRRQPRSPYSTRLRIDAPSPIVSGGLVSCCTINVTPKIAAAPSSRPTTMLAAAGSTNRFIDWLLPFAIGSSRQPSRYYPAVRFPQPRSARRWPIALAAVLIGLIVGAGYVVYPGRHSTVPPATASPAARPPEPQLAAPAAPVCSDDALLKMPVRDKLTQLLMVGVTGK